MTGLDVWDVRPTATYLDLDTFNVKVLADTENMADETGYERIVLAMEWNPWGPDQIGKFHLRVDQHPGASFATFEVWSRDLGWLSQGSMPTGDWWSWMPGFERATSERAQRQAKSIIRDLMRIARLIAIEQDRAVIANGG